MMKRRELTVLAYLDDFLIIDDTKVECQRAYETDQTLTVGELVFQGCKLCELRLLLSETTAKRSITKRDLQSLVGKLNFAARVVWRKDILTAYD